MYQLVTPAASTGGLRELGDGTKKISVIMQPSAGGQATYVQMNEVGGYHYVTQLDGPPPPVSCTGSVSEGEREELRRKFETVRQRVAIMQLDGPSPPTPKSHGKGSSDGSGRSHETSAKSSGREAEKKMSDKLQLYLNREGVQQCAPAPPCQVGNTNKIKRSAESVDAMSAPGHRTGRGTHKQHTPSRAEDGEVSLPAAKRTCRSSGSPVSPPHQSGRGSRTRGRDPKGRGRGRSHRKTDTGVVDEVESSNSAVGMCVDPSVFSANVDCISSPRGARGGRGRLIKDGGSASKLYSCSLCDGTYGTKSGLKFHEATKHSSLSVSVYTMIHICYVYMV